MKPYVYIIYNTVNGKLYVGKGSYRHRFLDHKKIARGGKEKYPQYSVIHAAMTKYGIDKFVFRIMEYTETDQEALDLETKWIAFLRKENYKLYNLTDGGEGTIGYKPTEETKAKTSRTMKGRKLSEAHRQALIANHHHIGVVFSKEVIDKMSEQRCGEKNVRAKLSNSDIPTILELHNSGAMRDADIAKKFGVSKTTIWGIVTGKRWKNI